MVILIIKKIRLESVICYQMFSNCLSTEKRLPNTDLPAVYLLIKIVMNLQMVTKVVIGKYLNLILSF